MRSSFDDLPICTHWSTTICWITRGYIILWYVPLYPLVFRIYVYMYNWYMCILYTSVCIYIPGSSIADCQKKSATVEVICIYNYIYISPQEIRIFYQTAPFCSQRLNVERRSQAGLIILPRRRGEFSVTFHPATWGFHQQKWWLNNTK